METALHPADARQPDAAVHALGPSRPSSVHSVSVTATYRLSEAGRKASLLTGGSGRQRQQVVLDVPVARMHLVHVDPNGTARLKLRPRFELRPNQRVVRLDEAPLYDAPPSPEALLHEAARNHELEAAYHAQGVAYRSSRLDANRSWRDQIAASFLSDATRRAVTHPSPTPRRCAIDTERGRIHFDAKRNRGTARHVPLEAYRRFQADLRARRERAQDAIADAHASHAEKQRLVSDWIAAYGSDDQRARLAAAVLPLDEAIDAMTTQVFACVAHIPRYERDGAARLQAYLRTFAAHGDAVVSAAALSVSTRELREATSAQWAVMQQVQAAVPDARVYLRERVLAWTEQPTAPKLRMVTVVAVAKIGPITLRREFRVPETCVPVPDTDGGVE